MVLTRCRRGSRFESEAGDPVRALMGGLDGDTRLEISGCGLNNDVLDRVAAEPQLGTDLPGMVKTGAKVEIAVATVGLSLVAESVYGHIERRPPAVYARTHAVGEGAVPPDRSHTVAVQGTEVVGGELRHRGGQQARCHSVDSMGKQ